MTIFTVKISSEYGKIFVNPDFIDDDEFFNGDLVRIENISVGNSVYGRIQPLETIDSSDIGLGENLAENLGVLEDSLVEISLYEGPVEIIRNLSIEYDADDYDTQYIQNNPEFQIELVKFLRRYYLQNFQSYYWPKENANLKITFEEDIAKNTPGRLVEFNEEFHITVKPSFSSIPFNALIALDCSGSMGKYDLKFANMEGSIENLLQIYHGESPEHISLRTYLQKLRPKLVINPEQIKIRRLDATFLSMLMFFNQKISRGKGEQCGVVLYSGKSQLLTYQGKRFFSTQDMTDIKIIEKIRNTMDSPDELNTDRTSFFAALEGIKEGMTEISRQSNNPIMVLFLTDGRPEPKNLEPPRKILAEIENIKEFISQLGTNFIIFTMGIGNEKNLNKNLLTKIAYKGNGKYKFTANFNELTTWFEELANEFTIVFHNNSLS